MVDRPGVRVLMITSSYPKHTGDGTSPFIAYLAEGVAAHRDWNVEVLLPHHPDLVLARPESPAHLHAYRYALSKRWSIWGYAASLTADREVKPRVLALAPVTVLSGLVAALRLTRGRPVDLVHAHWVLPNGPLAAWVAALKRVPLVVSLHGSDLYLAERHHWLGWITTRVFRRAAQVVACSENLRERAIRLGAPADRTHTIPYGVDLERFRPDPTSRAWLRERLGAEPSVPVVLAVGRLVGKKGFDVLVRSWPAVLRGRPDARLVLVGDGDLRAELEAMARAEGVAERVCFVGAVRHDEIARFYAGADVVAIPSVQDAAGNVDGLPNVLMEALAAGVAVVAARVGGIPQVVRDRDNGLLVEPGSSKALEVALAELLANASLRASLGRSARATSEHAKGWEAAALAHLKVYGDALAGEQRRAGASVSGIASKHGARPLAP